MNKTTIRNFLNFGEYQVFKTYTAGISLTAMEVKNIIKGSCSLRGSYVYTLNGVLQVIKMYIRSTEYKNRLILMNKKEIKSLIAEFNSGKVLIPKSVFWVNNLIKLELVLCKKISKCLRKKREKQRQIDISDARRFNVMKIKIN